MTILITGGAGCLAGDFVDYWQVNKKQEKLILVDNFSQPSISSANIEDSVINLIMGDASDISFLTEILRIHQPRAILHFSSSMEIGFKGYQANIQTLLATMLAGGSVNLPTIFYPQSFLTRNCSETISDASPIKPEPGEYPLYKSICENYLETYQGRTVIGIIGTTLSPRLSIGPIPAFTKRLLSDEPITISDTSRDYIAPNSVVEAILLTLEDSFFEKIVVIGSGITTSTERVFERVAVSLKKSVKSSPKIVSPGVADPKSVKLTPSLSLIVRNWDPLKNYQNAFDYCIKSVETSNLPNRQHHVK